MTASLKEHRGRVADVRINSTDSQAVSASYDGSCIIWDIVTANRIMCLFESTMFKQVVYHPDESQLITAGSDRKITYWDCYDGQAIRMLDGSETGELNAIAMYTQGEHFISSGNDKVIKVWDYDEGINYYKGIGHSGDVTKVSQSRSVRSQVTKFFVLDRNLPQPKVHRDLRLGGRHFHLGHPRSDHAHDG